MESRTSKKCKQIVKKMKTFVTDTETTLAVGGGVRSVSDSIVRCGGTLLTVMHNFQGYAAIVSVVFKGVRQLRKN